jgi:hypothetical protein
MFDAGDAFSFIRDIHTMIHLVALLCTAAVFPHCKIFTTQGGRQQAVQAARRAQGGLAAAAAAAAAAGNQYYTQGSQLLGGRWTEMELQPRHLSRTPVPHTAVSSTLLVRVAAFIISLLLPCRLCILAAQQAH